MFARETFCSSNLSSPSTQFLSPFGSSSVKMADAKKGKTPKEFFGAYAFIALHPLRCATSCVEL